MPSPGGGGGASSPTPGHVPGPQAVVGAKGRILVREGRCPWACTRASLRPPQDVWRKQKRRQGRSRQRRGGKKRVQTRNAPPSSTVGTGKHPGTGTERRTLETPPRRCLLPSFPSLPPPFRAAREDDPRLTALKGWVLARLARPSLRVVPFPCLRHALDRRSAWGPPGGVGSEGMSGLPSHQRDGHWEGVQGAQWFLGAIVCQKTFPGRIGWPWARFSVVVARWVAKRKTNAIAARLDGLGGDCVRDDLKARLDGA